MVFNENEVGSPLQLHLGDDEPTLRTERVTSAESNLCDRRWKEPEPTLTTANTEVTKDRIERNWKRVIDSNSLMIE